MLGWVKRSGQGNLNDREITLPISFNNIYIIVATLTNPNPSLGTGNCNRETAAYWACLLSSFNSSTITLKRDGGSDGSNCFVIIGT